jgi:hypothetical protein
MTACFVIQSRLDGVDMDPLCDHPRCQALIRRVETRLAETERRPPA